MKASGHFEITGPWGELRRGDTLRCVHCQHTWMVEPGSGRSRGYCTNCMGYVCGAPECEACINWERRLENLEAGRPELTPSPAMVLVPAVPG